MPTDYERAYPDDVDHLDDLVVDAGEMQIPIVEGILVSGERSDADQMPVVQGWPVTPFRAVTAPAATAPAATTQAAAASELSPSAST